MEYLYRKERYVREWEEDCYSKERFFRNWDGDLCMYRDKSRDRDRDRDKYRVMRVFKGTAPHRVSYQANDGLGIEPGRVDILDDIATRPFDPTQDRPQPTCPPMGIYVCACLYALLPV